MTECLTGSEMKQLLRGNLPARRAEMAESHLRDCADCRRTLDQMTHWDGVIATAGAPELVNKDSSPTLLRLMSELYERPPDGSNGRQSPVDDSAEGKAESVAIVRAGKIPGYTVQRMIARGGGGTLFEAVDDRLSRTVAIKILHEVDSLDQASRKRFDREARAVAAVDHANIVRLYGVGEREDGVPFLVMEYVAGETLRDWMDALKTPDIRSSVEWVRDVANALTSLHGRGLVHRDVKPSNVLLDRRNGNARLTDFGLVLPEDHDTRLTMEGTLAGTPDYISPEQIRNSHLVDHRTDVYSLGAVLFDAITGQPPFRGLQRMTLLQILHEEPPAPRQLNDQVPRDVETICLKALSKDPSRRYATAADMSEDLEHWLNGRPIQARPVSKVERVWRWSYRNPRIAGLLATVILLLTLGVVGASFAALRIGQARELANIQRDVALETLRAMVFEVNDELESGIVDFDNVQESLLHSALNGLENIPRDDQTRDVVDTTRLGALSRLGAIKYRTNKFSAAEGLCEQAIEIGDLLRSDLRERPLVLDSLAMAHWYLGRSLASQERFAEAIEHLQITEEFDKQLVRRDVSRTMDLMMTETQLIRLLVRTEQWGEAEDVLERAAQTVANLKKFLRDESEEIGLEVQFLRFDVQVGKGEPRVAQQTACDLVQLWSSLELPVEVMFDLDNDLGDSVNRSYLACADNSLDAFRERISELKAYRRLVEDTEIFTDEERAWVESQIDFMKRLTTQMQAPTSTSPRALRAQRTTHFVSSSAPRQLAWHVRSFSVKADHERPRNFPANRCRRRGVS